MVKAGDYFGDNKNCFGTDCGMCWDLDIMEIWSSLLFDKGRRGFDRRSVSIFKFCNYNLINYNTYASIIKKDMTYNCSSCFIPLILHFGDIR